MNEFKPTDLLAAEYVLGTLRGGARRRFESRLKDDAALAREVAGWQQTFVHLDLHEAPIQPPAHVWQAICERLPAQAQHAHSRDSAAAAQKPLAAPGTAPPQFNPYKARRTTRFWQWTSGALAACLAIVLFWPVATDDRDNTAAVQPIAVLSPTTAGSGAHLIAAYDARRQALVFTPLNVTQPDAQHSLQLWRIGADKKPVSLGLLNPGDITSIALEQRASLDGITLAVSLEPAGGSPTGQPTGSVLYAGVVKLALNLPGQ